MNSYTIRRCLIVAMLWAAACGAPEVRPRIPAVAPRQTHVEVRDSSVDALPDARIPVAPDIVLAIVDISADALAFTLRHRPGSFDPATTQLAIDLDTDQNASTGSAGIEYHVFVFPAGSRGADVARTTSTGDIVVGTLPVTFVADGCDVSVPLSVLGDDDGRFDFRVRVYAQQALPSVVDVLPDLGLVRIE